MKKLLLAILLFVILLPSISEAGRRKRHVGIARPSRCVRLLQANRRPRSPRNTVTERLRVQRYIATRANHILQELRDAGTDDALDEVIDRANDGEVRGINAVAHAMAIDARREELNNRRDENGVVHIDTRPFRAFRVNELNAVGTAVVPKAVIARTNNPQATAQIVYDNSVVKYYRDRANQEEDQNDKKVKHERPEDDADIWNLIPRGNRRGPDGSDGHGDTGFGGSLLA